MEKIQEWVGVVYGVVGKEVGKNKTPHLQGYTYFKSQRTFKSIKKKLPGAHIEKAQGTPEQNRKYCMKEGDFVEWGEMPHQGRRNDIEKVKQAIDEGMSSREIADLYIKTWMRYHKGIDKLITMRDAEKSKEWREVHVKLVMGPTGIGKTREALYELSDEKEWVPIPDTFKINGDGLKWWDGYSGESRLVIDEYANDVKITTLLGILDGHQLRLSVKGGFTYAQWTQVVITTNLFELHVQAKKAHKDALARRIDVIDNQWPAGAQEKEYVGDSEWVNKYQ